MIVLGFDTSTHATTVALRASDGETLTERDDPSAGDHPGHATRLLAMAAALLARAGIGWGDLDRLAVGVGPGRFTGLRVGVATARGLSQSLEIELAGVSSLHALAFAAAAPAQPVLAVIDALRGELFAAGYDGGGDCTLACPGALAPAELAERLRAGPATSAWVAVGDGAVRYRAPLQEAGAVIPEDASSLHLVDAAAICELGRRARPAGRLEELLPDYRRRPDAELRPRPPAAMAAAGSPQGPR